MGVLRLTTAGNVDDGKSTLIGRLLIDSKALLDDQLAAVEAASRKRGDAYLDLALVTDGLKAEREQGITIDVAYRYFSTPRRKFIIADCPGHVQYTRNMVTGASTADLAIVLVDVRKGFVEQTRRHCFVASLMRIPHLVVCVNKMDLAGYAERAFDAVRSEFEVFSQRLEIHDVSFIPVSALAGDNVIEPSGRMPWYQGSSLLKHLEEIHIASDRNLIDLRLPVQRVICPRSDAARDYRGYGGMIASGVLREGDEVVALPSGFSSVVRSIEVSGRRRPEAAAPLSVTVRLEHEIDLGRGDLLAHPGNRPLVGQDIEAMVCWMDARPLEPGRRYVLRHTSNEAVAVVSEVSYKLDVNTLSRLRADGPVGLNDFARIKLRASRPLCHDPYRRNRATGSFILIDEASCATAAAGIIL